MSVESAEREIALLLEVPHIVLFASARGALAAAVSCVAKGKAVTIPAFTCMAVPNAVIAGGGTCQYVDVNHAGLVEPSSWSAESTIIVQDTFGFIAQLPPPGNIVIRDASHRTDLVTLPGSQVAITSFEQSKSLSTGQGGLAVTESADLAARLRLARDGHRRVAPRMRHVLWTIGSVIGGRRAYRGSIVLAPLLSRLLARLGPTRSAGQSDDELAGGGISEQLLGRPNNSVCALIISQVRRLPSIAAHRTAIVRLYDEATNVYHSPQPLVRYPLIVSDPDSFERTMANHGWNVSGRWFRTPLHPVRNTPKHLAYSPGATPQGEQLAAHVVNLPTHPLVSLCDARDLIRLALAAGARPIVTDGLGIIVDMRASISADVKK
jgi:dTDP-4-amino-4,6-dideoxygalactose transaminase